MSIMRVNSRELTFSAIPLCQLLLCHVGPPRPMLSINLYVKGCLDCTIGAFHMSIQIKPSLLQIPSHASSSLDLVVTMSCCLTLQICLIITLSFRCSHASSSLDLVVTMSCCLTLQICLIITLSFHFRHLRFGFVNGQVSLAWSIALYTQELYKCLEREVAGRENW